ncbi:MAG TPA: substrate-binding domain-containing protein [Streptosporangiaceae bacterium]|nr:substrate-binding domain-containing protein [Streptosporangiaceae bacterium]
MRKFILAAATTASAGALALAGLGASAAQAATTHAKVTTDTVAEGVVTSADFKIGSCSGTVSVTFTPALASGSSVQAVKANATEVRLAGVFAVTASTQTYSVAIKCSSAGTTTVAVKATTGPAPADVVGVGSDTIQNVTDQFSADFNHGKGATAAHLYSWDATNPVTGAIGDPISTKIGCTAIPRPDGSSQGITALTTENQTLPTGTGFCMDFARSSRDRASTDPTSISFVDLAGDGITYSTQATTNAPGNLTTADLTGIYNCTITNWDQVGGANATIDPYIPQPGSGTRSFFLSAIGVPTPGACVTDDNGNLQENEGVNPVLNDPNGVFPYSIGKYLAERYHSPKCLNTACTAVNGVTCKPASGKNLFGCDTHGTMVLHMINGTNPTVPFPLTNSTTKAVINTAFTSSFLRTLFEVVQGPESGGVGTIPTYLQPFFGPTGYVCTNTTAKKDLANYGFAVLPAGTAPGDCGSAH